jgi:hypothetical protein
MTGPSEKDLRKGYRNAWVLTGLGILYIVVYLLLALWTNLPEKAPGWDMDGTPFVPASAVEAEGYYHTTGGNPVRGGEKRP